MIFYVFSLSCEIKTCLLPASAGVQQCKDISFVTVLPRWFKVKKKINSFWVHGYDRYNKIFFNWKYDKIGTYISKRITASLATSG